MTTLKDGKTVDFYLKKARKERAEYVAYLLGQLFKRPLKQRSTSIDVAIQQKTRIANG